MSFEEFKEILREEVASNVDADVTIVTVPKNNGVKLDALSVKCIFRSNGKLIPLETG